MTLRQRTAIAVLAACAVFAFVVLSNVQGNLAATAAELEKERASHSLQLASNALHDDVSNLNAAVGVWAQRDDSYQFMQDGNAGYIASNLSSPALLNLDVDFVIYVDHDGQIFYSKAVAASGEEISLPSGLTPFVTGDGVLARHDSEAGSASGVLFLEDNLVIAASRPIVTGQLQGPMAGALIMGRYLDDNEVHRLSMLINLSLEMHRVDDADMPEDFLAARSSLNPIDSTLVTALDDKTMASYMLVSEITGSPAFILRTTEPRDAYARAEAAAQRSLGLLIVISAAFALILTLGIDVLVISRLRRFRKGVEAVARSQSLSERMAIRGKDEVAAAAEVVNQALDSRERSHSALAASESRHRALVEAIPELLFRISREGTILETRKPQKVASLKDDHDSVEGQSPKDDILDMIPTEIQHIVVPHVAVALESGQTQVFEFRMSVDGNLSFYEGRVLGIGNDEALVIVRDITDQRRTEQSRQNVALLREIHDRVKSHLKLMRSFPEVRLSQAFNPTPEPGLPSEGQPTDTVTPAEGQEHITELPAEAQPQNTDPPVEAQPQDADPPVEAQPQNADPPAEAQPQNADPPAEAQPQNADPPAEAQPQNADPPAEAQPQNADPPAEAQPRHTEAVDAVPSAKGN